MQRRGAKRRSWSVKWWWQSIKVNWEELKSDVKYAFKGEEKAQGKRRGINDDGEALKGDGKALSGDGEALRMMEGMEGKREAPHMHEIAMLRR